MEAQVQVKTHNVATPCTVEKLCQPFEQAVRKGWVGRFSDAQFGTDKRRGFFLGDTELGFWSIINACPYCATDFKKLFIDYMPVLTPEAVKQAADPPFNVAGNGIVH